MKKIDMLEDLRNLEDEFSIASRNGRFFNAPLQYNFNCKYHNLKSELQDIFLDEFIDDDLMYPLFTEDLEFFIEEKEYDIFKKYKSIVDYIDINNTGFYGRSGGNFTIGWSYSPNSFDDYAEEDMTYQEIKEEYRELFKIYNFCEEFKYFMFNWFNDYIVGEIEHKIERKKEEIENEQDFIKKCEDDKSKINKMLITYDIKEDDMRSILLKDIKKLDTKIFHANSEIESHEQRIKELEGIIKNE